MESTLNQAQSTTVAAIIPVYNGADRVARAIESALAQTVRLQQIIVVDDGSTDHTADVVRQYPVTFLQQANAGPGAARNAGAALARAQWLAFLDHDDVWRPQKTERQLELACAERVGVIYSSYQAKDEVALSWESLWERNIVGTPTGAMIRRKCFFDVGGFDQRRFLIGTEDYHLWMRIARTNWSFAWCPGRLYDYTPAGNSLSRHFERMAEAEAFSYAEIGGTAGLEEQTVRRKVVGVNNHYIREFIGVRDLTSARRLIRKTGYRDVFPELLIAALCPFWALEIQRSLRSRFIPRKVTA